MSTNDPNVNPAGQPPHKPMGPEGLVSGTSEPEDSRTMAMLAHLLGGIFGILGALIIWLIKKDQSPFVNQEGKEATNFQLLIVILHVVGFILVAVSCGFLFFIPLIVWAVGLIFGILGGLKAKTGEPYRYPFNLRLIK